MNYDIHVYWGNEAERSEAEALCQLLVENQVRVFDMIDMPIGPHPLPMFEAHVTTFNLAAIEKILNDNRKLCSILIHEKTNSHMYDHTEGARWVGEPLQLNLEFLKRFN